MDVSEVWARLLAARQSYEGAREELKNLHLGVNRETGQRRRQLEEMFERQRDEAAEAISTYMLLYQEAARARDAESAAQLTSTNLAISASMKTWTVIVGVAAIAQSLAAIVQLWHGWGK
ncbi:MAG TPA: hypothetical protein VFK05_12570 [Polyangiaceae bacterium]|nr:hypothetical protein [Polyangiaceae bacterium]